MSQFNSRSRRRRVLNEEVLSASAILRPDRSGDFAPGDTPRYGAGANIENHPQVTDFVPRKYRVPAVVLLGGLGVGFAAELVSHFAEPISQMVAPLSAQQVTHIFTEAVVHWASSTLLLATAVYCLLVYSLRRHRVDDTRGRYRMWRTAALASLALSANSVAAIHLPLGRVMGQLTGSGLLPDGAGWWLLPTALFGAYLLGRLIRDVAECRGALAAMALAGISLAAAAVYCAGGFPAEVVWAGAVGRELPLAAHSFLLVGVLLYARYVVLDVQGLIEHKPSTRADEFTAPASGYAATNEPEEDQSTTWVDGTEPESDDEPTPRHLSKAERKRLRKQQRGRAA